MSQPSGDYFSRYSPPLPPSSCLRFSKSVSRAKKPSKLTTCTLKKWHAIQTLPGYWQYELKQMSSSYLFFCFYLVIHLHMCNCSTQASSPRPLFCRGGVVASFATTRDYCEWKPARAFFVPVLETSLVMWDNTFLFRMCCCYLNIA